MVVYSQPRPFLKKVICSCRISNRHGLGKLWAGPSCKARKYVTQMVSCVQIQSCFESFVSYTLVFKIQSILIQGERCFLPMIGGFGLADRDRETSQEGFRAYYPLYLFILLFFFFTLISYQMKFSFILKCVFQGENGHRI